MHANLRKARVKFTLRSLTLALKRGDENVPFDEVTYFYGQMGAGKTSIARLVDYCLGGSLELSPALQSEFVGATLVVELARAVVSLERPRDAERIVARWEGTDGPYQASVPTRDAAGEVIHGSGVENLSDLLFWLSGVTPPKVRKSKTKEDTELARLSMRDLLWYCYLDQDTIDSEFFHLDEGANQWKRLKSRDVLRFVIGFHEEHVAEIEAELDRLRFERQTLAAGISGLSRALKEVGIDSEPELLLRIGALHGEADAIESELEAARSRLASEHNGASTTHAADTLREEARRLGDQLAGINDAMMEIAHAVEREQRHLNEIETLTLKFRRSVSAKAVLTGVSFEACPRCAKALPARVPGACTVCGQDEEVITVDPTEAALLERDAKIRIAELKDILERHQASLMRARREREEILERKARIERERNEASARYDSAYLSAMLTKERERASLLQDASNLSTLTKLPRTIAAQQEQVEHLGAREAALRNELRAARAAAERDSSNLDRLKELFLNCLLRASVPGISPRDSVEIRTPGFLPEVYGPEGLETTVTSFGNMSSGGKKTLFKCCFAVAVHRLAVEVGATLPELLLIDSPMKNISERENREQFEGFHRMLYDLKTNELSATQVIIIDKEYCEPPTDISVAVAARHMRPNDPERPDVNEYPPLIPYYEGH